MWFGIVVPAILGVGINIVWIVVGVPFRSRDVAEPVPCPRCGHPMEDPDPDTVMCMECGLKAEYRAVKRAWRRVSPHFRPKQERG